jgi:hypothetical protein
MPCAGVLGAVECQRGKDEDHGAVPAMPRHQSKHLAEFVVIDREQQNDGHEEPEHRRIRD